ncbi:uncharacterized protein LOC118936470 isoform X2 [Oncorhynchus mykiss]|uniref:uncharacterized protein LOC118936470 isoform X2 n=1 Tax=Oncorhynchus mykiss TaxID=8022 RepID=UPI000B4FC2A7|nr:uncharacterized protein LOC118936470 isoform X2 [Oncorhynchus mykiss]
MGARECKEPGIPDPPTGALKVMVNKWGRDILEQVLLWHREGGFPLTGTLSVILLDEVRQRLEEKEDKLRKKDQIDWVKFRKWEKEADKQKKRQDTFRGKPCQNMVVQTEEGEKKWKDETVRRNRKDDDDRDCPPPYCTPQTLYPVLPDLPPPQAPPADPLDARPLQPAASPPVSPNTTVIDRLARSLAEVLTGSGVTPTSLTGGAVGGARQKGKRINNPFLKAPPLSSSEESEDGGAPQLTPPLKDRLRTRTERRVSTPFQYDPASDMYHQYPLMACPNPQPRPDDANAAAAAAWNPIVYVQRMWRHDEIKDIVEDLPDPSKDAVKYSAEMRVLVGQYKPSAAEIAHICKKKLGLRWADVQGQFDCNYLWAENGAYQDQITALLARIVEMYPTKTDWTAIRECTMKKDEGLEAFRKRLETCFRLHSGIRPNEHAYGDLLKDALVRGLTPGLEKAVRTTCISWETEPLATVVQHCKHAERQQSTQKE